MARQEINIGAAPNDGTGDQLRVAFDKVNQNETEIYTAGPVGSNIQIAGNTISSINIDGGINLTPNGAGGITNSAPTAFNSTIQVDGNANFDGTVTINELTLNTLTVNTSFTSSGTTTLANVTAGTIDATALNTTANVAIGGTLDVTGVSNLSTLTTSGNVDMFGGTGVIFSINDGAATPTTLYSMDLATGNATYTNNLDVNGVTTVNDLTISNNFKMLGGNDGVNDRVLEIDNGTDTIISINSVTGDTNIGFDTISPAGGSTVTVWGHVKAWDPVADEDLATKLYVDNNAGGGSAPSAVTPAVNGAYVLLDNTAVIDLSTTPLVIGNVYEIDTIGTVTDWSTIGGPNPANVGDIFTATATDASAIDGTVLANPGALTLDITKPVIQIEVAGANTGYQNLKFYIDPAVDPLSNGNTGLTEFKINLVNTFTAATFFNFILIDSTNGSPINVVNGSDLTNNTAGVFRLLSYGNGEWIVTTDATVTGV